MVLIFVICREYPNCRSAIAGDRRGFLFSRSLEPRVQPKVNAFRYLHVGNQSQLKVGLFSWKMTCI